MTKYDTSFDSDETGILPTPSFKVCIFFQWHNQKALSCHITNSFSPICVQYLSWCIALLAISDSCAECSEMFPLFPPLPSASNPCEENDGRGPCSHLCLINYNRTASCTCPHLMKLSPDKQSCFGEKEHLPHFSCFLFMLSE